jgi:hypothetical protein
LFCDQKQKLKFQLFEPKSKGDDQSFRKKIFQDYLESQTEYKIFSFFCLIF